MSDDKYLIRTAQPVRTSTELILSGAMALDEMVSNIEQTVFCLDVSGSMGESISRNENEDGSIGYGTAKIILLRKALKRYIQRRFQKHQNSRLGLVSFSTDAKLEIEITSDEGRLLEAAERLHPLDTTNMDRGLALAIRLLVKGKGDWIPRIVLISDGQPNSQQDVVEVLDKNKNLRVIVDTIYIGNPDDGKQSNSSYWYGTEKVHIEFMKQLAERTGGVFEMITSEKDFEQKFLAVSERNLLAAKN